MTGKKTYWTKLRTNFAIGVATVSLISVVVLFFVDASSTKKDNEVTHKDIESRIYPTPLILQQAIDHDEEVPTDVENFKRELRLIEQGDIQIAGQKKIDSQQIQIEENLKVVVEFFTYIKAERVKDSVKDIVKQKSRDARTTEIQNIGNVVRAIQTTQKDTIN